MIRLSTPTSLLLVLALTGCVSKGRMELAEIQLEATRSAMHAHEAANRQRVQDLEDELRQQRQLNRHARMVASDLRLNMEVLQEQLHTIQQAEAKLLQAMLTCEAEREACAQREADAPDDPSAAPGPDDAEVDEAEAAPPGGPSHERLAAALATLDEAALSARRTERHQEQLEAALGGLVEAGRLEVFREGEALVARIGVHVLFQEHRVLLSPLGEQVLSELAQAIDELAGRRLRIEGHTDPAPHHSVQFASNWELGFGRAVAVLRALQAYGLDLPVGVASYAGERPLSAEPGGHGRQANERVELRFTLQPPRNLPPSEPESAPEPEGSEGEAGPPAEEARPEAEPGDASGPESPPAP